MKTALRFVWRVMSWPFRTVHQLYSSVTTDQARRARDIALSLCGIACVAFLLANRQLHEDSASRGREVRRAIERIETLSEENERLSEKIDDQTSAEAQRRQRELIQQVIDVIDCENEDTIQRLIDVLEERGILSPGLLEVITDECEDFLAEDQPRFAPGG